MNEYIEASNGQVIHAPVIHTERGMDIEGVRFGRLVAQRVVDRSVNGNVWLLKCDCGKFVTRSTGSLYSSSKASRDSMCPSCRDACYGANARDRFKRNRKQNRDAFVARARAGKSLYSAAWEERTTEAIRADVAQMLGSCPEANDALMFEYDSKLDSLSVIVTETIDHEEAPKFRRKPTPEHELASDKAELDTFVAIGRAAIAEDIVRRAVASTGCEQCEE